MSGFIYQRPEWPTHKWDAQALLPLLGEVRHAQGNLVGKMQALGFNLRNETFLETLSQDVIKSSEIEGVILENEQVRSSIARKLGMDVPGLVESSRDVDGVVEMLFDATQNYKNTLTIDRLFGWHAALFPTGRSGMYKITVGKWRDDSTGPMQVVSGAMGKENVHFQAPPAEDVATEMNAFLEWFNHSQDEDSVLKAGIAHLWFVTIHPFEDGNGRIARAITDMQLARSEESDQRFYSMSSQIRKERKQYYQILESVQKGTLDITDWLIWFLQCLKHAIVNSDHIVEKVMAKHTFWIEHKEEQLNDRQIKIINMLFDGFTGKLTSSKYAKINKCSQDTALRDIQDLMEKQILHKEEGGGRSTSYALTAKT